MLSEQRFIIFVYNLTSLFDSIPGDLMLLVDHFLELFQQSGNSFKKQASLLLNHVLAGTLSMQPSETLGVDTDTRVYHETSVLETAVE